MFVLGWKEGKKTPKKQKQQQQKPGIKQKLKY